MPKRSALQRYGVAILAVVVISLIRGLLSPLIGGTAFPYIFFISAVAISGWYGRFGAGLLATVLSYFSVHYFFTSPPHSLYIVNSADQVRSLLFVLEGALISGLNEAWYRARAKAQEAIQNLRTSDENERRQREWFQITLSSIADGVIVTDSDGKVVFINAAAQSLMGCTEKECLNKPVNQIFSLLDEKTLEKIDNPTLISDGDSSGTRRAVLIPKEREPIPIEENAAPIKDAHGATVGIIVVFRDISERRKAEEQAMKTHQQTVSTLNRISDGFIALDRKWRYTFVNKKAIELFPRLDSASDGSIGKSIWEVFPEFIGSISYSAYHQALQDQIPATFEHYDLSVNKWFELRAYPSEDGLSVFYTDITQRKEDEKKHAELLEREHKARTEAEVANRLKDEFLATVSHELRTPLSAILGWSSLLKSGRLQEKTAKDAIETIERNAKIQTQIIADILDVSRIITGKLRIESNLLDISSIIEAAVDTVRPGAEAKGVDLVLSLNCASNQVMGDANRLQQVIWNLLSNAIKFTQSGGRVEVVLQQLESDLEIRVSDNGRGIVPEFLPYVFDRFRQADSSLTRRYGGLGLGLSIVRHLVELHGGSVRANSAGEGAGATFTVRLPKAVPRNIGASAAQAQSAGVIATNGNKPDGQPNLTGISVLLVDDEEDTLVMLDETLKQCGANVRTAVSSADGLEILRTWKPDVIISDIAMPGEDGYSFIRRVRALPAEKGGDIPAAALTAHVRVEDRLRVLSSGFQTHLPKPIEPRELVAAVASLAGRAGKNRNQNASSA
ncbi:MAG TPA: ATP-binding protein [Blastocatellia bacterium]|nr:ATP-binding protein [Blastocatellia bacterium]